MLVDNKIFLDSRFGSRLGDLDEGLVSDIRLFADDTSLFSIVCHEQVSADILNVDLKSITEWAYKWKMQFNPDKNKQGIRVVLSHIKSKPIHPSLIFNGSEVVTLNRGGSSPKFDRF